MRILLCPEYFIPHVGGGEVWLFNVSKILARKGYNVMVISYKHPNRFHNEIIDGVQIFRIGPFPVKGIQPYLIRAIFSTYGIVVKGLTLDYDIIMASQTFPLIPSYIVSKIRRKNVVAVFHDIYGLGFSLNEKGFIKGFVRGIAELVAIKLNYNIILTVSESTKKKLVHVGVKEDKIHVVGGGVNLESIDSVKAQKSSKPTIIFVGRLVRLKKVENLLLAFKNILSKIPETELYIVGSGPQEKMLKDLAKRLDLSSNVHFTGFVPEKEKIKLIKHAWVLVQPSIAEGFGLVLAEANACRTPVVAVDSGGPREVVIDGVTGFLVKPNDVKQLTEKILEILSDKTKMYRMGEDGRKAVEEKYTWEKVAEKVEKIILTCLNKKLKTNI